MFDTKVIRIKDYFGNKRYIILASDLVEQKPLFRSYDTRTEAENHAKRAKRLMALVKS
ncbi:MAG: hypothetical protein JRE40_02990 [Deltaproteobacteria bacterium]|nr:hypothetical protein [Deltaproteobacteria bacterium]